VIILILIIAVGVFLGLLLFAGTLFAAALAAFALFLKLVLIPAVVIFGLVWLFDSALVSKSWGKVTSSGIGPWAIVVLGAVLLLFVNGSFSNSDSELNSRDRQEPGRSELRTSTAPSTVAEKDSSTLPDAAPPPAIPTPKKKVNGAANTRLAYAQLLQAVYKHEGRLISVMASGDNLDTLELSSGLIGDGTYTLDAARRETVDCSECIERMKKLGFKAVILEGTSFGEAYELN